MLASLSLTRSAILAPLIVVLLSSSALFTFLAMAASPMLCAKATKSAFLLTKSVSQLTQNAIPVLLSEVVLAITTPSLASRSPRSAATFAPFFLSQSIAASKSPFVSVNALRQSIMPAPVAWRSLLMSAAVIVAVDIIQRLKINNSLISDHLVCVRHHRLVYDVFVHRHHRLVRCVLFLLHH